MSHGRRPPPPRRGGRTRPTIDSCPAFLVLLLAGATGAVLGLVLVIAPLA